MKPIVLEGKSVCKTFMNDHVTSNVIRNLDVEIYQGDFTVIMGASGAGKSTLLYVLSGIDDITSGEVHLLDRRIDKLKEKDMTVLRRKEIGFVFQEPNLLEDFTVFENIAMTGYLTNKNREEVNATTNSLIDDFDMKEHLDKYPSQLSGGQKQRVAIARSLINQPNIVFADEPTGALNATQSQGALDLLSEINRKGQTILMVTHDIRAASRANRLLYIKDGKIDGVLQLDQFIVEDMREREKQIFDFIMEKGW